MEKCAGSGVLSTVAEARPGAARGNSSNGTSGLCWLSPEPSQTPCFHQSVPGTLGPPQYLKHITLFPVSEPMHTAALCLQNIPGLLHA